MSRLHLALDKGGLEEAWRRVRRKPAPGLDGVTRDRFERDLDRELGRLLEEVRRRSYCPRPLLRRVVAKPSGGERVLGIPSLRDRTLQTAVHLAASPALDPLFDTRVHGYRRRHNPSGAVQHLARQVGRQPWLEIVKADVHALFDELEHGRLERCVQGAGTDPDWRYLNRVWMRAWATRPGRGVPQGAPLSPLLANLYLAEHVDRWLIAAPASELVGWIRYGDDIAAATHCRGGGQRILARLDGLVRDAGLELNPEKTVLTPGRQGVELPSRVLGLRVRFVRDGRGRWSIDAPFGEPWARGQGPFDKIPRPWWWRR